MRTIQVSPLYHSHHIIKFSSYSKIKVQCMLVWCRPSHKILLPLHLLILFISSLSSISSFSSIFCFFLRKPLSTIHSFALFVSSSPSSIPSSSSSNSSSFPLSSCFITSLNISFSYFILFHYTFFCPSLILISTWPGPAWCL